jgi:hypothetical protein
MICVPMCILSNRTVRVLFQLHPPPPPPIVHATLNYLATNALNLSLFSKPPSVIMVLKSNKNNIFVTKIEIKLYKNLNTQCGTKVPGLNIFRFPNYTIYWAAIELCSWNHFSQECKLALVYLQLLLRQNVSH